MEEMRLMLNIAKGIVDELVGKRIERRYFGEGAGHGL